MRDGVRFLLAEAHAGAGLWDQALRRRAIALDLGFTDEWGAGDTQRILEKDGEVFSPAVLDRLLQTLERARDPNVPPRIWEIIGRARGLGVAGKNASEILAVAEAEVARAGRADPFVLDRLARVQRATGDR